VFRRLWEATGQPLTAVIPMTAAGQAGVKRSHIPGPHPISGDRVRQYRSSTNGTAHQHGQIRQTNHPAAKIVCASGARASCTTWHLKSFVRIVATAGPRLDDKLP